MAGPPGVLRGKHMAQARVPWSCPGQGRAGGTGYLAEPEEQGQELSPRRRQEGAQETRPEEPKGQAGAQRELQRQ